MLNRCSPSPAGRPRLQCRAECLQAPAAGSLSVKLGTGGNGKCTNAAVAAAVPRLYRVATGATEGQAMGDSSTPARSGAATGGKAKRGRRPRSDPRKMLNADGDPLNSDPGSLGK